MKCFSDPKSENGGCLCFTCLCFVLGFQRKRERYLKSGNYVTMVLIYNGVSEESTPDFRVDLR